MEKNIYHFSPKIFPKCPKNVPKIFPKTSKNVPKNVPKMSQNVPKMFPKLSKKIQKNPKMFKKKSKKNLKNVQEGQFLMYFLIFYAQYIVPKIGFWIFWKLNSK